MNRGLGNLLVSQKIELGKFNHNIQLILYSGIDAQKLEIDKIINPKNYPDEENKNMSLNLTPMNEEAQDIYN